MCYVVTIAASFVFETPISCSIVHGVNTQSGPDGWISRLAGPHGVKNQMVAAPAKSGKL